MFFLKITDVEGETVSSFIKKVLPKDMSHNLHNRDLTSNDPRTKREIHDIIKRTFLRANEKSYVCDIFDGSL